MCVKAGMKRGFWFFLLLISVAATFGCGKISYIAPESETTDAASTEPQPSTPDPTTPAPTSIQSPYSGAPAQIPGTIQAENFDLGGEGVAYHETTAENIPALLRTTESVDIQTCTTAAGASCGHRVAWVHSGEWLEYTVNIVNSGPYILTARISTVYSGRSMHFELDGVNISGEMALPNTGAFSNWQDVSKTVNLPAGQHVLRAVFATPDQDVDYISFAYLGAPIVTNSSLESGLTAWEDFGNSVLTTDAYSGTKAVSVVGEGGIGQNVLPRLITGRSYRVSFFGKTASPQTQTGGGGMSFRRGTTKLLETWAGVVSTSYKYVFSDFVVPPNADSAKVYVWNDVGSPSFTADHFAVVPLAPSPGSSDSIFGSPVKSSMFTNWIAPAQKSKYVLRFEATPNQNNADVCLGMGKGESTAYATMATTVRFNSSGMIDVRTGSNYSAAAPFAYSGGKRYAFRMVIDIAASTYSVYAAPLGEPEVALAVNAAFRTGQAGVDQLTHFTQVDAIGTADIGNLVIELP